MIIKLIPGQRIALGVGGTEIVDGNYGPQIKFSGATHDDANAVLFLNVESATRQLERIGLTAESVVGQRIEVERVEKNGTKYTNIYRANGAPVVHTISTTLSGAAAKVRQPLSSGGPLPWENEETGAPPADALPHEKLDHMFQVYNLCLDQAHAAAKKRFGNDVTDEAVASMCATLFIAATKAGV